MITETGASERPAAPCRVAVVGTMGSGKTTLARRIALALQIPHVELDEYFWQPGWKEAGPEEFLAQTAEALAADCWVMDGNQGAVRELVWEQAEVLVWLDYSSWLVLYRLLRRTAHRLLTRTALWNGNRGERLGNVLQGRSLIGWVFIRHRAKRREYPALLADPRFAHLRVVRLRSSRQTEAWLRSLSPVPGPLAGRTVLQVADYGSPYSGNFVASLQALDGELADHGARQVLVLPERALGRPWLNDLLAAGTRIYILPENSSPLRTALRLWRWIAREQAAVVHLHFARHDLTGWLAAVLQQLNGHDVPVIWHDHGGSLTPAPSLSRRLKDLIKLRLLGRKAHAVPCSEALADELVERGLSADRAHFVPNGIDFERARRVQASRHEVRAAWGVPENSPVVLVFGWDAYRKGVDLALEAMGSVHRRFPRAILVLVGREPMERFVRERFSELPNWLRLTAPGENVADYYHAADIFLTASRDEGMPYSVAEALANNLVVVLSTIGGHRRYLSAPAVHAFTAGDGQALAAALSEALAQPARDRRKVGEANARFAARHFSLDAWTRDTIAVYERILLRARGW